VSSVLRHLQHSIGYMGDGSQTKTKVILGPFFIYRRIHFSSGDASFLWYLL